LASASLASAAPKVVGAVLLAIIKTIFALDVRSNINRTALFLMFFLLIHCAGNLLVFAGPDMFNAYGYLLNVNPLLKAIELYLLLAGVAHAFVGAYLSFTKRELILKKGGSSIMQHGKLALSSVVILVFIVLHLVHFKYGNHYEYRSTMNVTVLSESGLETVPAGTAMRDIYKLEKEVFGDPKKAFWYVFAIAVLGAHLWWGWTKSVHKLGLERQYTQPAIRLGQLFSAFITAGFISQPLYVYYYL